MTPFILQATDDTPAINFDFDARRLVITGESYPEDPNKFWAPVLESLHTFLKTENNSKITLDLSISFLNSTSFRAVLLLLKALERASDNGNSVMVYWRYRVDDEFARDNGKELERALGS